MDAPEPGRAAAEAFVARHLGHVVCDDIVGSSRYVGGQSAADAALASFEVTGYARRRNEVHPRSRRGASGLSPYIRHGLLQLDTVWRRVADGPGDDVTKFRDELLWQEYARHWYAHFGERTRRGLRREIAATGDGPAWDRSLACLDSSLAELEADGWLVNQARMWLASHWAVRRGAPWRAGEDQFFAHLLDGSRAANRLGWQWTTGVGSAKPYGFSRSQVERRAPGLCRSCTRVTDCPIADWPDEPDYVAVDSAGMPARDGGPLTGPGIIEATATPDTVWLTAESLGDHDPALVANPELPVVFVFDEPLLTGLRLSAKRLVFLAETLAELAVHRPVEVIVGDPVIELSGRALTVTHAPVPGFVRRSTALDVAEVHPWPWLVPPAGDPLQSFSAWRRRVDVPI